jgi:glycosyltransferase involved in cell wall biosynthesis
MFFRIIIPTYGNEPKLQDAIASIKAQENFNKLATIVVSHDNTSLEEWSQTNKVDSAVYPQYMFGVTHIFSPTQRWNGGNRNFAMSTVHDDSVYTLFLDHDDTIPDKRILVKLHAFIEKNARPDFIRLSYTKRYMSDGHSITKYLRDKTMSDVIKSNKVAPWTKCIKNTCLVEFPENTVFEDVIHHLKECDVCDSYANFPDPVVEWRMWEGQTSTKKGPKWESSKFRFIADLMDFQPKKKEVRVRRNYRIKAAIENIMKEQEEKNVSGEKG